MKVKELKAKYKGYMFIEMGYPDSIPFTEIPSGNTDEMEVKGYEVKNKPFTNIDITHSVFGGKKRSNQSYKGSIRIYLVSNKKRFNK